MTLDEPLAAMAWAEFGTAYGPAVNVETTYADGILFLTPHRQQNDDLGG